MICNRCKEDFGGRERCRNCGVHRDRPVKKFRRRSKIGGKRGRNSGTARSSKNKK